METKDPNKFFIKEERYNKNFETEVVVRHKGAMLEQMKNLYHAIKHRTTRDTIRIVLVDAEGNIIESTD